MLVTYGLRVLPHKHRVCAVLFPRAAPMKFVARLFCILLYSVIFCFACFASQTPGLGSAFPSAPVKSVTRFCYALVRNLFGLFCLTNTGFVQCYSLGSRKVCCTLVFNFALIIQLFLFCVLCLTCKHRSCAVLFLRLPESQLHAFVTL